ncbi:MAG: Peptidase S46 [Bacteroidetes bacterium ADurb.Bin139]|nr:MAG: Peptidase S46 [Bacteroidetes bacterium ADurb.Bin139]
MLQISKSLRLSFSCFILIFQLLLMPAVPALADEGMWLPMLIEQKIPHMQELGFRLTAEDIYSVNRACLKDAIVHFGGGCTGEIISAEGLLITNHHCGYGQIQAHSTVEHDYLKDGFWARTRQEELTNKTLTVTFLRKMEDVTHQVLEGATAAMSEVERQGLIEANIKTISEQNLQGLDRKFYSVRIAPAYYGNQYFLYLNETFRDVRLVGAPPSSIGKFGGDTDNWMWPRHTGDFSLFRIYAGQDNQPADYSPHNVPYRARYHLTISAKGVKPGDFTMVYGYPGRTRQYILSPEVDYLVNRSNPHKIRLRTLRLDVMNREQAKDAAVRIKYASKNAGVSNSWKKWQGESRGILNAGTIGKKQEFERRFQQWAEASGRQDYITLIPRMKELYRELEPYLFASEMYAEAVMAVELLRFANNLENTFVRSGPANATEAARAFFKDYYQPIDQEIFELLFTHFYRIMEPLAHLLPGNTTDDQSPDAAGDFAQLPASDFTQLPAGDFTQLAANLYKNSVLTDPEKTMELLAKDSALALSLIREDPAFRLVDPFVRKNRTCIQPRITEINLELNLLYRTWMQAIMEFDSECIFYPDANSTLRVTYGTVQGYSPADAVMYLPVSTIEGIMQKDDPQVFDYDIPQSLRDIYAVRDFGQWASNGTVPVCFIATNHTSGGNSGSPVLNADGHLLGLNFDRVWEGTMSDIEFDPSVCRNISVDIRYVLFIMEKIGKADYLLGELDICKD